ncbi:uncharacterized coiled-coil DUF342 family protein [Mycoplasmoides fastidiosum]|uniref:Uncharacterized coiled-coil DUF342 family protein n=1 Tax=Mycoplasmoides fastidiosum TaxID=92758 RepID=A0ABU0LZ44_9BACT|nr:hypothetical protein [Mycoplasmoides fastidiosum]MDQ0513976.1 uncharacterized coiled-coil DUF342 family protein [Mycoplasmoides fastidiosum]UUD37610.1 hypothetical protein NPA10_03520 [Mycoplasmoides fastidiosum]
MKKFNLFKKNKLWLASLGIATTSSLVLAACANQTQNTGGTSSGNTSGSTNTPGTGGGDSNQQPVKPAPAPEVKKPTEQQLKLANVVLDNAEVKTAWKASIVADQKVITDLLTKVTAIDDLNKTTVEQSITNLGTAANAAANEATSSVFALIKSLEDGVAKANTTLVPEAEKTPFTDAIVQVKNSATALLTSLQALPEANATKQLKDLQDKFTEALTAFVTNQTQANVATTLAALRTAKNAYEAEVQKVAQKLVEAEQAGFVLDSATSALSNYANTKLATFLSSESNKYSTTLNNLVTRVRTGVLGTLGADLWTAGNVDATVATKNRPSGIEDGAVSSQLYKIVVGLANQNASWKTISNTLKKLTFKQSAITKAENAVDLLAFHVENSVPVDVARLNAYLVTNNANVVKLLDVSSNSVKNSLEDIVNSISTYQTYLVAPANRTAKLVSDLTSLSTDVSSESDKTADKTKIDNFKTEVEKVVTSFTKFNQEWAKVSAAFTTKTGDVVTYPLLNQADQLNQLIGVSKNYADVVQVVAKVKTLDTLITQIDTAVKTTATKSALMTALEELIETVKNDSAFRTNLTSFAAITGLNQTNQAALDAIAKASTGYLHTSGLSQTTKARSGSTPANFSFADLKTELEKLQNADGKQLKTVFDLLNNQLQPNQGSQTFDLTAHLATLFNNGDVQPDTENH